jgi:hypothetical protein
MPRPGSQQVGSPPYRAGELIGTPQGNMVFIGLQADGYYYVGNRGRSYRLPPHLHTRDQVRDWVIRQLGAGTMHSAALHGSGRQTASQVDYRPHTFVLSGKTGQATPIGPTPQGDMRWRVRWNGVQMVVVLSRQFTNAQLNEGGYLKSMLLKKSAEKTAGARTNQPPSVFSNAMQWVFGGKRIGGYEIQGEPTRIKSIGGRNAQNQSVQGDLMSARLKDGGLIFWLQGKGSHQVLNNTEGKLARNALEAEAVARSLIKSGKAKDLWLLNPRYLPVMTPEKPGAPQPNAGDTRYTELRDPTHRYVSVSRDRRTHVFHIVAEQVYVSDRRLRSWVTRRLFAEREGGGRFEIKDAQGKSIVDPAQARARLLQNYGVSTSSQKPQPARGSPSPLTTIQPPPLPPGVLPALPQFGGYLKAPLMDAMFYGARLGPSQIPTGMTTFTVPGTKLKLNLKDFDPGALAVYFPTTETVFVSSRKKVVPGKINLPGGAIITNPVPLSFIGIYSRKSNTWAWGFGTSGPFKNGFGWFANYLVRHDVFAHKVELSKTQPGKDIPLGMLHLGLIQSPECRADNVPSGGLQGAVQRVATGLSFQVATVARDGMVYVKTRTGNIVPAIALQMVLAAATEGASKWSAFLCNIGDPQALAARVTASLQVQLPSLDAQQISAVAILAADLVLQALGGNNIRFAN